MYESLTKYIDKIDDDMICKWVEEPGFMPYVDYTSMVDDFVDDVYKFLKESKEVSPKKYRDIINANGIDLNTKSVFEVDPNTLDGSCVFSILLAAVRAERFSDGVLENLFKNGHIKKWLQRLKAIDEEKTI